MAPEFAPAFLAIAHLPAGGLPVELPLTDKAAGQIEVLEAGPAAERVARIRGRCFEPGGAAAVAAPAPNLRRGGNAAIEHGSFHCLPVVDRNAKGPGLASGAFRVISGGFFRIVAGNVAGEVSPQHSARGNDRAMTDLARGDLAGCDQVVRLAWLGLMPSVAAMPLLPLIPQIRSSASGVWGLLSSLRDMATSFGVMSS